MPELLADSLQLARTGPRTVGAGEFLTALFGPYYGKGHQGFIEIRMIGADRARSYYFRGLSQIIKKRFKSRWAHTFYGLLPRERRNGKKDAAQWLLAFWADLDGKNFTKGKDEAWMKLRDFQVIPSAVVDSGHGLQALWFLKDPVRIEKPEELEAILAGLAAALEGDSSVCEVARVFRLPGSFNVKDPKNPIPVKVRQFSPWNRYELSDFESYKAPTAIAPRSSPSRGIGAESSEGLEKVMACKFVRYSAAHARDLPEPLWWSLLSNLLPFKGGRDKAHQLSRPYEKDGNRYSFKETERKINYIVHSAPGPHTCRKIMEHGYPCSFIGTCPVEAPAGLAWAEPEFIENLRKEPCETEGGNST